MRLCSFACAAAIAAIPASAQEKGLAVDLLPGHPIHHEVADEGGVVMAFLVTPGQSKNARLTTLCDQLRATAGLKRMTVDDLALKVVFVIPYKGLTVEGYYFPINDELEIGTLISGNRVARQVLDDIVSLAGIPPDVLDETDVEHELSCELNDSAWFVRWEDVRPLDGEAPNVVIERAHGRFMTVYQGVLDHNLAIALPASLPGEASPSGDPAF